MSSKSKDVHPSSKFWFVYSVQCIRGYHW